MWPVWPAVLISVIVVAILGIVIYLGADALLTQGNSKPAKANDAVKITVSALTLMGSVLAGVYTYRKQLLAEGDALREDARYLAERYSTAAEQLGHEQAAVRLAGVYAMARLADGWLDQRQVCIDVLCAYIRMPYQPDPHQDDFKAGEREVRLTIIRIIREHLQNPTTTTSWCGYDLDFTGATFDGGDFRGARFTGGAVHFDHARFTGGTVKFEDAQFTGSAVHFNGALFGSTVNFDDAQFTAGSVDFDGVSVDGGAVNFESADFAGGCVSFSNAQFTSGRVNFSLAKISGGTVLFIRSYLTGGKVDFIHTKLTDGVLECRDADFSGGEVNFNFAEFSGGEASFSGTRFNGSRVHFCVSFTGGEVFFNEARFSEGEIDFTGARIDDGDVDFRGLRVTGRVHVRWGPFPVIAPNAT